MSSLDRPGPLQPAALPPQLIEFLPLLRFSGRAGGSVNVGLADPLPHRRLGQIEVTGDLPDRTIAALAQLDDLRLELRCERPTSPGLFLFPRSP